MKRKSLLLALMLFGATAFNSAFAQQTADIPQLISYQGLITATDGKALPNGRYQLVVTFYADENGTTPIWNDTYSTALNNGVFDLYLGSNTPLPSADAMNRPLWVGVKVNGAEEMRPLTRLTSSPYAMNVPDKSITTSKLATGAVTADKVSMNYVAGITINGQKLEGNGTVLNITSGKDVQLNYDKNNNTLAIEMTGSSSSRGDDDKKSSDLLVGEYSPAPVANFNWIAVPANYSTISGGQTDSIFINTDHGTIGGGLLNKIRDNGDRSTIGGGSQNQVIANVVNATIAGGELNIANGSHASIGGGRTNIASGTFGTIAGGTNNIVVSGQAPSIGGGERNTVRGNHTTVGGGVSNTVAASSGTIGGGERNQVIGARGTVGGGLGHNVLADFGTIGGGNQNSVQPSAQSGTIGGGETNLIDTSASYGTVGGGVSNTIRENRFATIGGGAENTVEGMASVIAGGLHNLVTARDVSTIGGGAENVIDAQAATIAGGKGGFIVNGSDYATIGGGFVNLINSGGFQATIPGGNQLQAQSWAQTVIGTLNIPKGATPVNYGGGGPTDYDQPIFIVGNGWQSIGGNVQSNAFEVSYSGHSTVFDINGSGGASGPATGAKLGGTYVDNVIYAWADVNPDGKVACDFGVAEVKHLDKGRYLVTINPIDADGNPVAFEGCASVTATVNNEKDPTDDPAAIDPICRHITVSKLRANRFNVIITQDHCDFVDSAFMFKVTARP